MEWIVRPLKESGKRLLKLMIGGIILVTLFYAWNHLSLYIWHLFVGSDGSDGYSQWNPAHYSDQEFLAFNVYTNNAFFARLIGVIAVAALCGILLYLVIEPALNEYRRATGYYDDPECNTYPCGCVMHQEMPADTWDEAQGRWIQHWPDCHEQNCKCKMYHSNQKFSKTQNKWVDKD